MHGDAPKTPTVTTLLLAAFLAVNPIVLLLLMEPVWAAIFWPACVACLFVAVRRKIGVLVYAVNFAFVAGIFLSAECVIRVRYSEWVIPNPYVSHGDYYCNKENLNEVFDDKEYRVVFRTNEQGLRVPANLAQEKSVERADWLFLGDSFTQAAQVEFEEMFSSIFFRSVPTI